MSDQMAFFRANPRTQQAAARKLLKHYGDTGLCLSCPPSYVMEDVGVATELWAFWNLISAQADRLQRDAPELWESKWAPTLRFVVAALDAMSESVREQGKKLSAEVDLSNIILT